MEAYLPVFALTDPRMLVFLGRPGWSQQVEAARAMSSTEYERRLERVKLMRRDKTYSGHLLRSWALVGIAGRKSA